MAPYARLWPFLTICLVIQGVITCVSGKVSDLTSSELEDAEHQCKQWISRVDTKTMFRNASGHMSCPCNEQLIEYDVNFEKNGGCYEQFFFQDGVNRRCCYSDSGMLNSQSKDCGYVMIETYKASIKSFHELCCLNKETCDLFYDTFPLDDCKHYRSPTLVKSWGDAHIQTVSGDKYDFNGLGEYVYLDVRNVSLTIQCRLEYITERNKDATIFTAFAIKVGNRTWEIRLNRTSGDLVYNNKSPILQAIPIRNNALYVHLGIKFVPLTFSGGSYMTLTFASQIPASMELKGLAGNSLQGLRLKNSSTIELNSSESNIYDFGQSWRLNKPAESMFLYNNGGNFTYYNRDVTKPRFPGDFFNNIINMFTTFGNHSKKEIQGFLKLCNVSDERVTKRCLISIARTNSTGDADTIMTNYNIDLNKTNYRKDQKPHFKSNFPNYIRLKLNLNSTFVLEVSSYVHDNDTDDTLTYEVRTAGNITIEIDKYNGTLTLYVDEALRYYKGSILVVVTDKWSKLARQNLHIQFCGCEHPNQCVQFAGDFSGTSTSIQQTECTCGKYFEGSFCETKLDVCNVTKCFKGVPCYNTTKIVNDTTNPCGPCTTGYSGDGMRCEDINECTSNISNCQQICDNIEGGYTCSCEHGYAKNGSSCLDIDECKNETQCKNDSFTECVNNPGSFSCACKDDYSRDSSGKCSFDTGKYVYIGQLNLTLTECGEDATLEELSLTKHLYLLRPENDENFANVELINRTSIRAPSKEILIFGLHSHNKLNWTYVQNKLNNNPHIQWNVTTTKKGHACVADGETQLFQEADNMLCKTLDKNKCDETTTRCVQQNGESLCECKDGYEHKENGPVNLCYDVDECVTDGFNCSDNGKCRNTFGNWTCDCPVGFSTKFSNYNSVICEDIDECNDNSKYACQNGICHNSLGSWECQCNTGYDEGISNGKIMCKDVDECSDTSIDASCTSTHGTCNNTEGNWTCDCLKGYQAIYYNYENITCEDIDECQVDNECVHGTCTNSDGGFECECPDNLATKVKKNSGITICTGSNHYQSNITMNSTKELTETEKHDIATRLEIEIQSIYAVNYKDVSVIVSVTIVRVHVTLHQTNRVKKRAADTPSPPTTYQYNAVTNTYLNAPKDVEEMSNIFKNETTVLINAIHNATNTSVVLGAKAFSVSKVITTTTRTTMEPPSTTPRCSINCQNGGTCVTKNGDHQECRCLKSYEGNTCEVHVVTELEDPTNGKDTILYALVGTLGGLVIIMAIVIVVVCRRSPIKRRKAKDNKAASERFPLPQIDPYAVTDTEPNYVSPQTFVQSRNHRSGVSNPDYHTERQGSPKTGRSGSPTMCLSRDERLPSISDSSRDSGMDISKESISMDRHNGNLAVEDSLSAQVDKPRVVSSHL